MKYWGDYKVFGGSAGILPAAAGNLPVASSRRGPLARNLFLPLVQAVRQDAGQSGQHARARHHDRFTI